jgi:disulfide bond formation protein DsbB
VHRRILGLCTLVAVVATGGSLYFSEVMGLWPCELCWFQRVLMYPLVVVLGVSVYERRSGVWRTGLPLSVIGTVIAAYHSLLQAGVISSSATSCGIGCSGVEWRFTVFTIPRLSLVAFVLVTAGLGVVAYLDRTTG